MTAPASLRDAGLRLALLLEEKPGTGMTRRHWAMLAMVWAGCTLMLFLFRPGYTFPPHGGLDGWIYSAYQWDLRNQIRDFGPTYYGSRLSWILPGALLHSLLSPMAANITYKLIVSVLFAMACGTIVHGTLGLRATLLAVSLSVLSPQFIESLHTDYIDTAVIVYAALTLACITVAKDSTRWPWWIFLGGCCYAGMVIANLSTLASVGAGVAAFHLVWLRWDFRRQIACVGLYLAAGLIAFVALGLIHRAAGGDFFFLKPQLDMLAYMRALKENPWIPKDPLWFTEATWLLLPAGTLLWGLYCSFLAPPREAVKRLLVRSLTASLTTSFLLAALLQIRALNATLSFSFYASFHLCLALPLLAACLTIRTHDQPFSSGWLLTLLAILPGIAIAWDSQPVALWLFPYLPFLHSFRAIPLLLTGLMLLAAVLTILAAQILPGRIPISWRLPGLFLLGLFGCSMSIEFHGPNMSDRLRERYETVHTAYRIVARELPLGSYRYWLHSAAIDGKSLASTKLWGYRLFSQRRFPDSEPNDIASIAETQTIVVPGPPGGGQEILASAARIVKAANFELASSKIIPVPGDAGTGFDLACFSVRHRSLGAEPVPIEELPVIMLMDLKYFSTRPYTLDLGQNLYGRKTAPILDNSPGYPVFTRTDPRDHLATDYRPLPKSPPSATRELSVIATMPADGHCVGVVQIEECRTIAQINWTRKGRFEHKVTVPTGATSLRLYLQSSQAGATPLPTRITIRELPP